MWRLLAVDADISKMNSNGPPVKAPPAMAYEQYRAEIAANRVHEVQQALDRVRRDPYLAAPFQQALRQALQDESLANAREKASKMRYVLEEPMWDLRVPATNACRGPWKERSHSAPPEIRRTETAAARAPGVRFVDV